MYVDNNFLSDLLEYLWLDLAASIELIVILLGFLEENKTKIYLTINKYIKTKCSYIREQLRLLIKTKSLTLTMPNSNIEKAL